MTFFLRDKSNFESDPAWLENSVSWLFWHFMALISSVAVGVYFIGNAASVTADKVQLLLAVFAYLFASVVLIPFARLRRPFFAGAIVATALAAAICVYLLLYVARLPVSLPFLAGYFAIALGFLIGSFSAPKQKLVITLIVSAVLVTLALAIRFSPASDKIISEELETALHEVELRSYPGLVAPVDSDGGAFASRGMDLLLATGDGRFYWITRKGDTLGSQVLEFLDPTRRVEYLRSFKDPSRAHRLRVTDVIFSEEAAPRHLYAAHQSWNESDRCFTMTISSLKLSWNQTGVPESDADWSPLYETRPCVKPEGVFDDSEFGGRLAWSKEGDILLTLGHVGHAGLDNSPPFTQIADNDYGKILSVDTATGSASIVSRGHRNPQGLVVRADGEIWSAEHGPQGGDEINHIVAGENYGWPYVTYGTKYGTDNWPLNPDSKNHGEFKEPAFAFTPSIAISALIEVQGSEFPKWSGDLLAGSLRTEAIFRVRLRENRVIYVESTSVGHRVRDLIQMDDGRIYIWSDSSAMILELRRRDTHSEVKRYCSGCHEAKYGFAAAPPLDNVFGREIASMRGYPYSKALKSKTGIWTRKDLEQFLIDPDSYAPGTRMKVFGMDAEARGKVLDELEQANH